ncbi:hypothetical protein Patl1_05327 [Pistacia atlantica]|uniref:Uncharacterized protein n=1 Tax=Pistacia atlantica TaxID=434234 RepID=A0ACC1BSS2_9ROSI|nr:hypothetical protein Patl1_05327 [Pistacia atlantica]
MRVISHLCVQLNFLKWPSTFRSLKREGVKLLGLSCDDV